MKDKTFRKPTTRIQFELNYFKEWIQPRGQFLFLTWLLVMGFLFLYTQHQNEMLMLEGAVMEQRLMNDMLLKLLWY